VVTVVNLTDLNELESLMIASKFKSIKKMDLASHTYRFNRRMQILVVVQDEVFGKQTFESRDYRTAMLNRNLQLMV